MEMEKVPPFPHFFSFFEEGKKKTFYPLHFSPRPSSRTTSATADAAQALVCMVVWRRKNLVGSEKRKEEKGRENTFCSPSSFGKTNVQK